MKILYDGAVSSVECVTETHHRADCDIANQRAEAWRLGAWAEYDQLENAECTCDPSGPEQVCGFSGEVDGESDGAELRFTCPRCLGENTVELD